MGGWSSSGCLLNLIYHILGRTIFSLPVVDTQRPPSLKLHVQQQQ